MAFDHYSNQDLKRDDRPAKGLYVPGRSECQCYVCQDLFAGTAGSIKCADCAYAEPVKQPVKGPNNALRH